MAGQKNQVPREWTDVDDSAGSGSLLYVYLAMFSSSVEISQSQMLN